jgi:hypothetical protein
MLAFSNGLALSFRAAQYAFKSFQCTNRGVLRPFSQFATVCRSDAQGRRNGRDSFVEEPAIEHISAKGSKATKI